MVEMIHRREESWEGVPFASLAVLADFVAEFDELVREAMPDPPRKMSAQVSYEHGSTGWLSGAELKDVAGDLGPLEEVQRFFAVSGFVDEDGPEENADTSDFRASIYVAPWSRTTLGVEGRKLTAVEGVFGAAKAGVDRYEKEKHLAKEAAELNEAERKRQAESIAAILKADVDRAREQEGRTGSPAVIDPGSKENGNEDPEEASSTSWLRQFVYDPWTVTIGGGVIVALVVVLLTQT